MPSRNQLLCLQQFSSTHEKADVQRLRASIVKGYNIVHSFCCQRFLNALSFGNAQLLRAYFRFDKTQNPSVSKLDGDHAQGLEAREHYNKVHSG